MKMNILLVNPEIPDTFWSFRNALKFIAKKSSEPPLGLLTVAAMLPADWNKQLVDLNVTGLKDETILWADYVFLTGMAIQRDSFEGVVQRCNQLGKKVVAGGPMCTMDADEFPGVDYFVLNEAELTLPLFIKDLLAGHPEKRYESDAFPDISKTPVPMWELLEMRKYASMSLQYSRGCPFNCDFCTVTLLNGHKPRTKSSRQFLAELQRLYDLRWRGGVFIVDDNFIGNRRQVKTDLLPALIQWSEEHHHPFNFITEASINLADDDELVDLMVRAGFDSAFIGIETVSSESLSECGKAQNLNRDMVSAVQKLHQRGIMVSGGFIVGFDNDPASIFDQLIQFIQKSGIVTAMVGLLNAPKGTALYRKLQEQNRLLKDMSGNNMDGSLNFIPRMEYQMLINGYHKILHSVYGPKAYYERVKVFLKTYRFSPKGKITFSFRNIQALVKSMWILGVMERGRIYYWKLFFYSLLKHPRKFALSITLAIYGFHFRRVVEGV